MAGLMKADLAIGRVEDEDGDVHQVTVAVLIADNRGIVWQSREAWGVGPGSALAGAFVLEDLKGDVEAQAPDIEIDWGIIERVREDLK